MLALRRLEPFVNNEEQLMYHFEKQVNDDVGEHMGRIMSALPTNSERSYTQYAQLFGSLYALFGEPTSTTSDPAYVYLIKASDLSNKNWIFRVYQGASGPAIGGDMRDASLYPVIHAFLDLIHTTPPANVDFAYYEGEYDVTVFYRCFNGHCTGTEQVGYHLSEYEDEN